MDRDDNAVDQVNDHPKSSAKAASEATGEFIRREDEDGGPAEALRLQPDSRVDPPAVDVAFGSSLTRVEGVAETTGHRGLLDDGRMRRGCPASLGWASGSSDCIPLRTHLHTNAVCDMCCDPG